MTLYYNDNGTPVLVTEVMTNHSMSIEDILTLTGINMDDWAAAQGWEAWDYNDLYIGDDITVKHYMVDVAKAYMKNGVVAEYREAHNTEYATLEEAQTAYDKAVQHWQAQPDKPVCITLSERDGDMWDGIKSEVVQ